MFNLIQMFCSIASSKPPEGVRLSTSNLEVTIKKNHQFYLVDTASFLAFTFWFPNY